MNFDRSIVRFHAYEKERKKEKDSMERNESNRLGEFSRTRQYFRRGEFCHEWGVLNRTRKARGP